jgi:hypothetical protein
LAKISERDIKIGGEVSGHDTADHSGTEDDCSGHGGRVGKEK